MSNGNTHANKVVEWIPYDNLQNIKYLTKGGCSEIYTADWINGRYEEWDSKEQQLERTGTGSVVLKRLENVGNADQRWFGEVCNLNAFKEVKQFLLSLINILKIFFIG